MKAQNKNHTSAFPNTSWTLLAAAYSDQDRNDALNSLLRSYWRPVYVFFRSRSKSVQDAEDMTQGFFQSLLTTESLRKADPNAGRLRAFLLTMAKRFQIDEWRRDGTQKRGGSVEHISLDTSVVEALYFDGKQEVDGEYLYDRSWGYALLSTVSDRLQARYEKSGKSELYEAIKGCLTGDGTYEAGADLAAELGISPESLRGAVFRLRRQFRECVTEEVAKTCESKSEIQEEIAFLCRILAG